MSIFFLSIKFINIGDNNFVILSWCELFLCKFGIYKMEKVLELKNYFKNENDIDDLSYEFILVYALLRMFSFNMEYKKIYFDQTSPESIFSLNQARSHCMECYDGNFCSKCLENTVISDNKEYIKNKVIVGIGTVGSGGDYLEYLDQIQYVLSLHHSYTIFSAQLTLK